MIRSALAVTLLAGALSFSSTTTPVRVLPSVGHLLGEAGGQCTVASIGASLWLGAAHCAGLNKLGGAVLREVKVDDDADLRLLAGPPAPALRIASEDATPGEPVTLYGWTDGYVETTSPHNPSPLIMFGHTSTRRVLMTIEDDSTPKIRNLFDAGAGPGMSGGPIVNARGEIVGVVEAILINPSIVVVSPTVQQIRQFLGLKVKESRD
jgi:hypothetical protein